MKSPSFTPTWKWHFKVWGIFLLLCTAAFWLFTLAAERFLPPAYQYQTATPQITPWLDSENSL